MNVVSPEIIPGKGVGVFQLGWTLDQLKQHIKSYRIKQRNKGASLYFVTT